jgi:dienelactone hydrolase/ketosteroid isomerase-like protein
MKRLIALLLTLIISAATIAGAAPVSYQVGGQPFEGYYLSSSPNAPLILLVHDWDGLTDYEIRRARMLADEGYAVFAADLFGAGVRPVEFDEKRRLTGQLYEDRETMRGRLRGALEAAAAQGGRIDHAVAMGYCFGGTAVLELARSGAELKGFVTFHGGLDTPEGQDYSAARGRLLIMHGTADQSVTMDEFAALARELEDHGVAHEMITYSGAPHAFTVFDSDRYRADADRTSWQRFLRFLEETLAGQEEPGKMERKITGGSMDDREELSAALDVIIRAGTGGRVEGLGDILDDEVVMVFPGFGRRVQGRKAMIGGFEDFAANAEVHEHRETDARIDVIGRTAVISYRFELIYTRDDVIYRSTGRDLWVFHQTGGRWLAVWRTMLEMEEQPVEPT